MKLQFRVLVDILLSSLTHFHFTVVSYRRPLRLPYYDSRYIKTRKPSKWTIAAVPLVNTITIISEIISTVLLR